MSEITSDAAQRRDVWKELDMMFAGDPRLRAETKISDLVLCAFDEGKLGAQETGEIFCWLIRRALVKAPLE